MVQNSDRLQAKPKARAAAFARTAADGAAPLLDGDAAEKKTESRFAGRAAPAHEFLKKLRRDFGRNAGAVVVDGDDWVWASGSLVWTIK